MNRTLLWLDDLRDPFTLNWLYDYAINYIDYEDNLEIKIVWVKSFDEFKTWIETHGLPTTIGFDHDLGEDIAKEMVAQGTSKKKARLIKKEAPSGYDAAKWLVEYCMDNNRSIPEYFIQSANPVGKVHIETYLENAKKHLDL